MNMPKTPPIKKVIKNKYGNMVCLHNGKISCCPLEKIYGKLNLVDIATQYDADRYNGRRSILNDGKKKNAK